MSEDDDWFERALRDADEESDGTAETDRNGESAAGVDEPDPFGGIADSSGDEEWADEGWEDQEWSGADETSDSPDGEIGDETMAADAGSQPDAADDPFGGETAAETNPSGGSPAETDDPFGGVREDPDDSVGQQDPFGGGRDDPFGGVRADDAGEDPFGEEFEAAMGAAGGGGGEEFDEAEFDSDIERVDIGIDGLDEMILGGVPLRSLITVIGSAGTGKTTFGLQFLQESLSQGGQCVYITLEETEESILSSAEEKGWPFGRHVEQGNLVVVSMDPIEMANSLDSIRGDLTRLITQFGADRLVLDSVSLLEMMYDDPATRRSEVFDFARSLKRSGVTTLLTSEASGDNAFQSRHGLVEYLVDAVFVLRYVRPSDFQETRLAVEIQKIRDANHSRETKPYDITDDGIDVYRQANLF